jgi:LysM repeat protein
MKPIQKNTRRLHPIICRKPVLRCLVFLVLLTGFFSPVKNVSAESAPNPPAAKPGAKAARTDVTAYDLIIAMNTLRVSYGNSALIEDPIIDAVAQSTAEIMAANKMSSHIGDVSGRLKAAGYGGGAAVQGTENFAVGSTFTIDEIMAVWSDAAHMLPVTNSGYCNVGAGIAKSADGLTYYVLQAGFVSGKSCGAYTSTGATVAQNGETTIGSVSQVIVPVQVATPDESGKIYHVVQAGQSFWSIAIAYKLTVKDLQTWNNLDSSSTLQTGQKLFIPSANTAGYFTPTPVGMFTTSTPEPDGKIVHTVQAYQTLSSIAQAYGVTVSTILGLNRLQEDWPLQIGQSLIIHPSNITPSPTPRPLTPIEKLTPSGDGKYYHTVQNGENLAWIANLYQIGLNDLMGWNGLNGGTVLQPGMQLLLQVTPPPTATYTPSAIPPTATATLTATPAPPTATATPSATPSQTPTRAPLFPEDSGFTSTWFLAVGIGVVIVVVAVVFFSLRKK